MSIQNVLLGDMRHMCTNPLRETESIVSISWCKILIISDLQKNTIYKKFNGSVQHLFRLTLMTKFI